MGTIDSNVFTFFKIITDLGGYQVVILVTLISVFALWVFNKYRDLALLAIAVIGSIVTTYTLKLVFRHPRPDDGLVEVVTHSFPSGHSTVAISLYLTLFLLLYNTKYHYVRYFLWILIILIPISRIVLQVHYLVDVVAGVVVGIFWIYIAYKVTARYKNKKQKK